VDYSTDHIMVTFVPGAQLPAGWSPASPASLALATAAPNPQLLQEKQYAPLAAAIADRFGLLIHTQVYIEDQLLASFQVPSGVNANSVLAQLRSQGPGLVAHAVYEPLRHATYTPNDPDYLLGSDAGNDYSAQWGTHRVRATDAWDYTQGDPSIIVAVCDTGVRITHEELSGQALDPNVAFPTQHLNVADHTNDVSDAVGHGTYCAGLIAAKGNDSKKIIGLAFGCKVMPIKISDNGSALDSDIAAGCNLADSLGAQVINLSFGGPNADPQLKNMVNKIASDGKFLAIAAGNDNTTAKDYPGGYSDICVGATGTGNPGDPDWGADTRAPYSNYGTYVDICAPGSFLKSTTNSSDTSYSSPPDYESGTSFATPLVAAGAALLLSYDSTLTREQLKTALETTGDSAPGFQTSDEGNPVLRMNLANAFASVAKVSVKVPQLSQLVQSGTVSLTPTVNARAKSVDCIFNGASVGTLTAAPWTFNVDTTGIGFGAVPVQFVAHDGADSATASMDLLVDNTVATFPIMENFNAADPPVFAGVDAKTYSAAVITALNDWPAGTWTPDAVATNGPGLWSTKVAGGFSGLGAYGGQNGNTYGSYELDCLVSRKVDLTKATLTPTLVFHHRYNIEDGGQKLDQARVLVTADGGKTFSAAKLAGSGNPAVWSGDQANFIEADVDLSDFATKKVNLVLLFQSDGVTAGENTSDPAGWWVDSLVVSTNYSTNIPTIDSVALSSPSYPAGIPEVHTQPVVGKMPNLSSFDATISGPKQVNRVLYWLDLAPYGTIDLYDPVVQVTAGPDFKGTLTVPNKKNQDAVLRVQYFDAQNNPGPEVDLPVHLFNLAGDTNADGTVNQADIDGYAAKIGLTAADPGYSVFFDTDLDGTITEADASGVGYNWGKSS
jgi:subtilisin family serine protease